MRILHIGKFFPPHRGGMETFLCELMVAQRRQGLDVSALVHRSERSLRGFRSVWREHGVDLPITRAGHWASLVFTPISPTFSLILRRCLTRDRPDILHLHLPNPSAVWLLFSLRARALPWIIHWHADIPAAGGGRLLRGCYRLFRPFEQALLRRASVIIATSPPYLASSGALADHRDRCRVIPLGITPVHPGAGREMPGSDRRPLRLLCVGRHTYYKGIDVLLEAMVETAPVQLRLVGAGERSQRLAEQARGLGVADRVQFLGELPTAALRRELAACDCIVLPSIDRAEAFGVVLLEAMQFSKPAIVTDVPGSGMAWVVEDGVTGRVVRHRDAAALAEAIRELANNRDTIRVFGRAARARLDEKFHSQRVADAVSALYREALGTAATD